MPSGQDLDPRLKRDDIIIAPIGAIPDKSYDVVVSIDVIEHVESDREFLRHLTRIAREAVFLTTPLSFLWREVWPYHIREYRAREFLELTQPFGRLTYYKGTPSGSEIYPVNAMRYFRALDRMMNSWIMQFPLRATQKLLPKRMRYNSHQAALIHLHRRPNFKGGFDHSSPMADSF
jgi:methyltransferase family protein